jgi:biopolymer transport protein ExbD
MKHTVREHKKARIEIIPLIDVIFFCLATFVLVTLAMNKNRSQRVSLAPGESGVRPAASADAVTVTLNDRGELFWGIEAVSFDQLLVNLSNLGRTEDPKLLLNFDRRAMFGQASLLLDEIRKAGISRVQVMHAPGEPR